MDLFGIYISQGLYLEDILHDNCNVHLQYDRDIFKKYYDFEIITGKKNLALKPVQKMPERLRAIILELEKSHTPGYSEAICMLLDMDSDARQKFIKSFDRARKRCRARKSDKYFTMILSQGNFATEYGIACVAVNSKEIGKAILQLEYHSRLKIYGRKVIRWVEFITVIDNPELIHKWVIY